MPKLPLEGIRVAELCPIWAGPYACMLLADWGAEVIRVENRYHFPVYTRGMMVNTPELLAKESAGYVAYNKPAYKPEISHNLFTLFNAHARNKLSMTVNLRESKGVEIFKELIKVCDVFVESNSPRVKEELGITWDSLKEVNNKLVMISMPGFGSTGPYKYYRALGAHQEGFGGHTYLRGYTGDDLSSTTTIYHTDEAAGLTAVFAILSALRQRRKTEQGTFIDMAQGETSMPHLAQAIMDYTMNGRIAEKMGNRDYHGAIQGCYQCRDVKGKWLPPMAGFGILEQQEVVDTWVVITISNDNEWEGFCKALGNPEWTKDAKFSNSLSRFRHHDEIDEHIGKWTRERDAYEVMHLLQDQGVPAGPVMDEKDAYHDPHLRARGFFEELTHAEAGTHLYPGLAFRMSGTSNSLRTPPVRLGEHNEYVYKQLLGFSDEEYAILESEGHIGSQFDSKAVGGSITFDGSD
ncbi:MAG: CoA transferase [Chloroflexota bacterium]|nr:CoA transferase [Chloroflexota bacterium]